VDIPAEEGEGGETEEVEYDGFYAVEGGYEVEP
jgi:hypothetical protein